MIAGIHHGPTSNGATLVVILVLVAIFVGAVVTFVWKSRR